MTRTPLRRWPLPIAAIVPYVVLPFIMAWLWTGVLKSGMLPPDGDSIGIPIFEGFAFAIVCSPLAMLILWLSLRGRTGGVAVPAVPRGWRDGGWTIMYLPAATGSLLVAAGACAFRLDPLILVHLALSLLCLLLLHAEALSRRT